MYYKSTDPNISTNDWISLNTSAIPQALVSGEGSDLEGDLFPTGPAPDFESLADGRGMDPTDLFHELAEDHWLDEWDEDFEPTEIEWDDLPYDQRQKFFDGLPLEVREITLEWPIWYTLWVIESSTYNTAIEDHLVKCGFTPVRNSLIDDHFGLVVGIDGAGYSFHGQHWIPLRVACAWEQLQKENDYRSADARKSPAEIAKENAELFRMLKAESDRQSGPCAQLRGILALIGD